MKEADLRRVLSSNIKHFRGLRSWSQVKLAEKIGISTNFLADIETANNETKRAIKSLIGDISVKIEHSLSQISKKYLK